MERLNKLVDQLWELLKLQFFWYLFSLRGGIIFGVFPATAAAYSVVRDKMRKKTVSITFQDVRKYYRSTFHIANKLGWLLTVLSIGIGTNWMFVPSIPHAFLRIGMYGILVMVSLFLLLLWTYMFSVLSHFRLRFTHYLLLSLQMGLTHLSHTMLHFLLFCIWILFNYYFIHIGILIGLPILIYTQLYINMYLFQKDVQTAS